MRPYNKNEHQNQIPQIILYTDTPQNQQHLPQQAHFPNTC